MGISDKEKFVRGLDSRHSLMFAHIYDMAVQKEKYQKSIYGDFLSEESISELLLRQKYLPEEPVLYGGFEDSQRQMAAFISEYDNENFPIDIICVNSPHIPSLSHRDFLGSVLALGIKREKCGDIIINNDKCFIAVHSDVSSYVLNSLKKVGRTGVRCEKVSPFEISLPKKSFEPVQGTVSSLRLDAVVALFIKKGRSRASEIIDAGFVFVNGICSQKADMHLEDGAIISVRGVGKAHLSVEGTSKKERIFITLNKYC